MSDGDACGSACGWCGMCSDGYSKVERTCAHCGDSFNQPVDGPYRIHVLCDDCIRERDLIQVRREDFFGAGQKVKVS